MYQALYRKWRPLTFADVIGQQPITDTLRTQVRAGRLSHAYLFTGTRGTGKTTCAKILARAVNCENPQNGDPCGVCAACQGILSGAVLDVTEIDAASNNGVDNIRDLRDETRYTPAQVKKRVFIIDEVHMLSIGAFNALLKTLEEPPPHVLFILATTELHKVPATILSRCQRFDFRRIDAEAIAQRLLYVAEQEHIALEESGARLIARLADGAMRDALSMLDRAAASCAADEDAIARALGVLGQNDTVQFATHIKQGELADAVQLLGEYYNAGRDLAGVYDQMLGLIRDALLVKSAKTDRSHLSALLSPAYSATTLQQFCAGVTSSDLLTWSQIISQSLDRMRNASNRRMEAELCAVRLCTLGANGYETLGGRVEALEEKLKYGVPVAAAGLSSPVERPAEAAQPPSSRVGTAVPSGTAGKVTSATAGSSEETDEAVNANADIGTWPQWSALLEALEKDQKIEFGTMAHLKLCPPGKLENNTLLIICPEELSADLIRESKTLESIQQEVTRLNGGTVLPVKVRMENETSATDKRPANWKEIQKQAQSFGVPITKL